MYISSKEVKETSQDLVFLLGDVGVVLDREGRRLGHGARPTRRLLHGRVLVEVEEEVEERPEAREAMEKETGEEETNSQVKSCHVVKK